MASSFRRHGMLDLNGHWTQVSIDEMSPNSFEVLGVSPHAGRVWTQATASFFDAVLTHGFWVRAFRADPAVIGKSVNVEGRTFTVIGILDKAFAGFDLGNPSDVVVVDERRDAHPVWAIGRISPVTTRAQVAAEADVIGRRWAIEAGFDPERVSAFRLDIRSAAHGVQVALLPVSNDLVGLTAIACLIFSIAMINCMFLASHRLHRNEMEYRIRAALGASRSRLAAIVLAENCVAAVIGVVIAVALARLSHPFLVEVLANQNVAGSLRFEWNGALLAATCCGFAAGVLVMWLPAFLRLSNLDRDLGGSSLRGVTLPVHRWMPTLADVGLAGQTGAAIIACLGAIAAWRSYQNLSQVDLGYATQAVWAATIDTSRATKPPSRLYREIREALETQPGVQSATLSITGLFLTRTLHSKVWVEGVTPADGSAVHFLVVGPGFFETSGSRLVSGREFSQADDENAPAVAIVNHAFVRQFAGGAPISQFRFARPSAKPLRVIGVVADSRHSGPREAAGPVVYIPLLQWGDLERIEAIVRMAGPVAPRLRRAAQSVDPALVVYDEHSLHRDWQDLLRPDRVLAFGAAAAMTAATVIMSLGLYAVFAYRLRLRRREFAIRLAVGASRLNLAWAASARIAASLAVGACAGLMGAAAGYFYLEPYAKPYVKRSLFAISEMAAFLALALRIAASADLMDGMRES
jgi:predicted permease